MKALFLVLTLFFVFSVKAQYVQQPRTITTEDLNIRAQQLTQQCVYLHIIALSSTVLGITLIGVSAYGGGSGGYGSRRSSNPNAGIAATGFLCILGGGVCGVIEWIKVAHAHNILSLGNPKLSFNSSPNGIGFAYNF